MPRPPALATAIALALGTSPAALLAQDGGADRADLGTYALLASPGDLTGVSGSAQVITPAQLQTFAHADINRVLRTVPGLYLQEEEGYGLRPNIGIRGSGLDRNNRIAVLEDGVLIAPAPYAAPAAYYFPTQRRINSIEVLKGPAAVSVGPRTTGGAINLLSTPIPYEAFTLRADAFTGTDTALDSHVVAGGRGERVGWMAETVQQRVDGFKRLDGGARTGGYDLQDYQVKLRVDSDPAARWQQGLELKLKYTEQDSDTSYLGLTEADFRATPYRRYAGSQLDNIASEHWSYQATWTAAPVGADWDLSLTAYRQDFERNWFKVQSVDGVGIAAVLADPGTYADQLAVLRGGASEDDSLALRNNRREYHSQGLQGRFAGGWQLGDGRLDLRSGFRLHRDEEDRFQEEDLYRMDDGTMTRTTAGTPGTQANRVGEADVLSLFAMADWRAGAWTVSPGLRWERIELTRTDYSTTNPDRSLGPTNVREHTVNVFIPSLGAVYALDDNWHLLAGVSRGFNPPAPGSTADEETSVNWEAGVRYLSPRFSGEAIAFHNRYSNLVGTVTESTGGGGTIGDQYDGGRVRVQGLELTGGTHFDLNGAASGLSVPLRLTWTWTETAEFRSSFSSDFGDWGNVLAGDELPYMPEHQWQLASGLHGPRFTVGLTGSYLDRARTVAGSGPVDPLAATDSHFVVDLAASWRFTDQLRGFARVDNLLDETYAAARRPAGVRPGKDRTAMVGLRFQL